MPSVIPDIGALERRLAGLPVTKHPARKLVVSAGSTDGKLLFLRSGAVEVVKDGVRIANVSAPGAVFGEQSILLDQPHTADVTTLEQSEFYVAMRKRFLLVIPRSRFTSRLFLPGDSTPRTDQLSNLRINSRPASLPT